MILLLLLTTYQYISCRVKQGCGSGSALFLETGSGSALEWKVEPGSLLEKENSEALEGQMESWGVCRRVVIDSQHLRSKIHDPRSLSHGKTILSMKSPSHFLFSLLKKYHRVCFELLLPRVNSWSGFPAASSNVMLGRFLKSRSWEGWLPSSPPISL